MAIRRRKKLTLHRETMRVLSDPQLAAIAGGNIGGEVSEIEDGGGLRNTAPKSNAWTGGIEAQPQAICGQRH